MWVAPFGAGCWPRTLRAFAVQGAIRSDSRGLPSGRKRLPAEALESLGLLEDRGELMLKDSRAFSGFSSGDILEPAGDIVSVLGQ